MNTGQMLITIGAIFLLSVVILTVNRGFFYTSSTMEENRYGIIAVSLATSTIEKATGLAFDHESDTLAITSPNSLTTVSKLGLETGESANNPDDFNDIDDYKCYKTVPKKDSIALEGTDRKFLFHTYCDVVYVDKDNPNTVSNQRTWHKKITVRVESPDIEELHPITMSTVYSYWFFR